MGNTSVVGVNTCAIPGTHNTDGSWTLSQSDLSGLTLHAGDDDNARLTHTVTPITNDAGNVATSAAQTISLTVNPVAETPTLTAAAAAASVNEDGTVGLTITATAAESDADATTTVTITGVPTNASLNHGTHNTDGSWTLSQSDLSGLTLHAGDDDTASLTLTVTASTSDAGNLATSAAQTISLTVNPLAETPTLTAAAAAASVTEDGTVGLNITATAAESDADATTTVTNPKSTPLNSSHT